MQRSPRRLALRPAVSRFAGDYVSRTREFSRNANLYVLHVIGMDMIHGSWTVVFNLYLLAIGFDIRFIGLRLVVEYISRAVTALPAGLVSDRIGRKASFILGDGVGAVLRLFMILTTSEFLLLALPAFGTFFGNLHHTAEPAFMAENSRPTERVHLFAVAGSLRTFSAMIGALIAGLVPVLFIDTLGTVGAYRYATYAGLALWFLSLIPAVMLRTYEAGERPEQQFAAANDGRRGLRSLFSGIQHPRRIAFFVLTSGFAALGFGVVGPLFNVVFHEGHTHAEEGELGVIFASGELALAAATLLTPLLLIRLLRVDAIVITRLLSLPFVLGMGLWPLIVGEGHLLVLLVGASYVGRISTLRMGGPLDDAFNMDVLDARERATNTGLEIAASAIVSAGAIWVGARMLDGGDFTTPFLIMAGASLVSTAIYWRVFRPLDRELHAERQRESRRESRGADVAVAGGS
jgi:MFS family permease